MRTKILIFIIQLFFFQLSAQDDNLGSASDSPEVIDSLKNQMVENMKKKRKGKKLLPDSLMVSQPKIPFKQKMKNFGQEMKTWPKKIIHIFDDEHPKPKKALIMSFILPGSGQVYNKKDWKLPIVYGGLGGLSYLVSYNTQNYRRFRTAYISRLDDDPDTIEEIATQNLSDDVLKNVRDFHRKKVERSYLGLFGFYLIVGIDAFVDAHLADFTIDEDLLLGAKLRPSVNPQYGVQFPVTGLGLSWDLSKKRTKDHKDFKSLSEFEVRP